MRIELLERLERERQKTQEEIDEDKYNTLIKENYAPQRLIEYKYRPLVVNLKGVGEIAKEDRAHTLLKMKNREVYIIQMNYNHFLRLFEQFTGQAIVKVKFQEKENVNSTEKSLYEEE